LNSESLAERKEGFRFAPVQQKGSYGKAETNRIWQGVVIVSGKSKKSTEGKKESLKSQTKLGVEKEQKVDDRKKK